MNVILTLAGLHVVAFACPMTRQTFTVVVPSSTCVYSNAICASLNFDLFNAHFVS